MKDSIKEIEYYECDRCNITSETNGRMCPCPRGSCEAKHKGKIIEERRLDLNKTINKSKHISKKRKNKKCGKNVVGIFGLAFIQ